MSDAPLATRSPLRRKLGRLDILIRRRRLLHLPGENLSPTALERLSTSI
jgi:hypothetical protein